ncbi:MAG: hypothetical protein HY514_02250 [Candidatus Aenigmarchaeota archaeon]|nr:hypothetical protein [Candidatus Aenigmarchaeota archaeon]
MDYSSRRIRTEGGFLQYVCPKCPAYKTHCHPRQRMMAFCKYLLLTETGIYAEVAHSLIESYLYGHGKNKNGIVPLAQQIVVDAARKVGKRSSKSDIQEELTFQSRIENTIVREDMPRLYIEKQFLFSPVATMFSDLLWASLYETKLKAYEYFKRFIKRKK